MSVKQEAVDDFMAYIDTYFQKTGELVQCSPSCRRERFTNRDDRCSAKTVYSEKCRSWYKKGLEGTRSLGP